ncbi:twin-arginine translocase TatA/TatE family subunit [Rhabdothermincola sediminis]|jgi:sec-independent protein translocase protein TatB|uniref:twin-arginine translocase TatA/TatE family subunit n=1 Tax=Rhabdothermincola sediminis TaxID=2751370 RepID=UPI001AA01CDB|nr:twin-arginine translocase TatA/TatE family subunit [Rhabdothermincola sediminis]
MFNVGGGEVLVILLLALIVLGPDKLPEYTRKAARVMGELRRISHGFQQEMRQAMELEDDPVIRPAGRATGPRLVEPPSPRVEPGASGAGESPTSDSSAA